MAAYAAEPSIMLERRLAGRAVHPMQIFAEDALLRTRVSVNSEAELTPNDEQHDHDQHGTPDRRQEPRRADGFHGSWR